VRLGQPGDIKRLVYASVRGCGGKVPYQCGGGGLSPCHPVGAVIIEENRDIDISSGVMDEVIPSDGRSVSVPCDHDDVHLRVCRLDAHGKGDGSSVRGVKGVEVDIARSPARTADPRDHSDTVLFETEPVDGPYQRLEKGSVPASRTPDMGEFVLSQVFCVIKHSFLSLK
jgi:hypothetical protein